MNSNGIVMEKTAFKSTRQKISPEPVAFLIQNVQTFRLRAGIHKRFYARKRLVELTFLQIDCFRFFPFLQMLLTKNVSVSGFFQKVFL